MTSSLDASADTEISNLHLPLRIDENVLGLDVTVNDLLLAVYVLESLQYLVGDDHDDGFGECPLLLLLEEMSQGSHIHVLEPDANLPLRVECPVTFNYVR